MPRSLGLPRLRHSFLLPSRHDRALRLIAFFCVAATLITSSNAAPTGRPVEVAPIEDEPDLIGLRAQGTAAKALQDTVWIADWNFDSGGGCVSTGWVKYDNRIANDGSNYWTVSNAFADSFGIVNNAAVLRKHDLCWVSDGYGNDWDYSIICKYKGTAGPGLAIAFNFLSDSEPGFDFVQVEADSAGASESRVNYSVNPKGTPAQYRTVLLSVDGVNNAVAATSVLLPDFGVSATTHEAYIRFISDGAFSPQDGDYLTRWPGLVVDNIAVTGALAYTENFEGPLNPNVSLVNSASATPFGEWARLFNHITDNDKCTENTTCAWLYTDPLRIAFFPDMAFGPGAAVIRNWLDDIFVSPWVSLASTPTASGTVLSFRRFGGNSFAGGKIVQGWRVRGKEKRNNTDTSSPGDSIDCVSPWGHTSQFNSLASFVWITNQFDMTTNIAGVAPQATEVQVAFRASDWQFIAWDGPPATINPGPGPYNDRIRIGRRVLSGPVFNVGIDTRTQAQDCFTTVQNSIAPGQHFSPDPSNVFGTCAFSEGTELGLGGIFSTNLITGDSIQVDAIVDARGAGGVSLVEWYGAITSGPHAGKAPAPYTVSGNGFFQVRPDSCRAASGTIINNRYFVDMDDTYFRGGDALKYYWYAGDIAGGRTSAPPGIGTTNPASIAAAELATGGLFEVNYLPTINWDPTYLAAIAADAHGDLDPTPEQVAGSTQKNCILYYQHTTSNRRSGETNRTSFMYTLDRLGYRGYYDVYDVQGYGNTNNQLGGRANVAQCTRYALIIEDDGRSNLTPNIPNGSSVDNEKVNQAQWYRNYLAQGLTGAAGIANLWVIGENTAFEKSTNALFTTDMGLASITTDQGLNANPNVNGVASFTCSNGNTSTFAGDAMALSGGCPSIRAYDTALAGGGAVITHRYAVGTTTGNGAVIMNKNTTLHWNTVWMGFGWFDIRDASGASPASGTGTEDVGLARKILTAALPVNCGVIPNPVGVEDPVIAAPRVSALHANVPNPFNPTTVIRFDLAEDGHVRLHIYDVAGKLVRTLADEPMQRGYGKTVTWDGFDVTGRRAPSGVFFYRLDAAGFTATRKMVLLK